MLVREEKEVLYGNFFIEESKISDLQEKILNLKKKMSESDVRSAKVKERDYTYYRKELASIINQIG